MQISTAQKLRIHETDYLEEYLVLSRLILDPKIINCPIGLKRWSAYSPNTAPGQFTGYTADRLCWWCVYGSYMGIFAPFSLDQVTPT